MKIAVTGDTHGNIDFAKLTPAFMPYCMDKPINPYDIDVVIVCGDAGFVWDNGEEDKKIQEAIKELPYTLLCVLGNHENYAVIDSLPITKWNGIKVRKITDNCYYLVSPQVFELDGRKFFIMNGARSLDKVYREENVSWWKHEMPTNEEYHQAAELVEKTKEVDYVITHCPPSKVLYKTFPNSAGLEVDELTNFYEWVNANLSYKTWYFGHLHMHINSVDQFNHERIGLYSQFEFI